MKIQLASDLHLDFLQRDFPGERLIAPARGADLLVLAGDIANGTQAIELFKDWPVPVLYLAGNHEFYGCSLDQTRIELRHAAKDTSAHFLDNDVLSFGGVRFLGYTLWTDYRFGGGRTPQELMENAERQLTRKKACSRRLERCKSMNSRGGGWSASWTIRTKVKQWLYRTTDPTRFLSIPAMREIQRTQLS